MAAIALPEREHITRIDADDPLPYYYAPLTVRRFPWWLPVDFGLYVVCACAKRPAA